MICLGIETSCDETGLALVKDGSLLASVLAGQVGIHAIFGGVVPELASREHGRYIGPLFDELIKRADITSDKIDVVAVTRGPGLLGSLLVGVGFAKALALTLNAKFLGINHLHAHLAAIALDHNFCWPAVGLLVSGGHTHLYHITSPINFKQIGQTLDDAAGETFDKVGKMLGLPYPCGSIIDSLSSAGFADKLLFPRPYLDNDNFNFSFSGLKTAVLSYINNHLELQTDARNYKNSGHASETLKNFCASFNLAVVDTLCTKTERALDAYPEVNTLLFAGGVASNTMLRNRLIKLMIERRGQAFSPLPALCTDNAVMVAFTAWLLCKENFCHSLRMETIPRGKTIPNDLIRGCHHKDA